MKFWHTVLFRHRWHGTRQFRSVNIDGWFTIEEQLHCDCGSAKWSITRDSIEALIAEKVGSIA